MAGGVTFSRRRQPGAVHDTYTLAEMSDATLARAAPARRDMPACWSIRCRRCIPTSGRPPTRPCPQPPDASVDRAAYTAWLTELRAICTERAIVLNLRRGLRRLPLAPGGAQEYSVEADIVTYGDGRRRFSRRRGVRPSPLHEALS